VSEAKKLMDAYCQKMKELQENCPHKEVSGWIEEGWAPAHSTGYLVKVCKRCGKEVDRVTWEEARGNERKI